jgi:DNA-directed RNA polymerase subunit M/transcription elongation factor TFIIS
MDSIPNINTVSEILKNYIYIDQNNKEKKLDQTQIKKLLNLKKQDGSDMLDVDLPYFSIDLLGLISEIGFDDALKYYKENKSEDERTIIFGSDPFSNAKRVNYIDLVSSLIEEKVEGIYKCKKCGSWNTITKTIQTRRADEPATEFTTCKECGNKQRE